MKIAIGTENKRKIAALERVFATFAVTYGDMVGCRAVSGVADTPFDEATKQGAVNRARHVLELCADAEMSVGIESGLVERYGDLYEEVWVAMVYRGEVYTAYSSGVKLPKRVTEGLSPDMRNHPEVMNELRERYGVEIDPELGVDTWGDYTGFLIKRDVGLEEAVRNVLVQVFPAPKSLYREVE